MSLEPDQLIAEAPIREALRALRPDAAEFHAGVLRRLDKLQADAQAQREAGHSAAPSQWLRTAASVAPWPLVAKGAGVNGPWTAKLVGWLAAPAVMLLAALGGFVLGVKQLRSVQRGATGEPVDPLALRDAGNSWWRSYGAVHMVLCVAAGALMLLGHTLPVLLAFVAYGAAVVALVTRLGKAGLIDRATVAAGLAPALMLSAQLVPTLMQGSRGVFLVDQSLAAALMCLGAAVVALLGAAAATTRKEKLRLALMTGPLLLLVALYGSSALRPVTPADARTYVETTDVARFSSATWRRWAIVASWLRDADQPFDDATPRAALQRELAGEENSLVLGSAFVGGLVDDATARQIVPAHQPRFSLVAPQLRDRPLTSIRQNAAEVLAFEQLGRLAPEDRDVLADRLVATIAAAVDDQYGDLVETLVATQLLDAIGRGEAAQTLREPVQRMIAAFQRLDPPGFGARGGGFARYRATQHGDDVATAAAVELMETYGTPAAVDGLALRSFLRPGSTDWLHREPAILRSVALWRFESLPKTRPITWRDYARCEYVMAMAALAVALSIIAVLGCPRTIRPAEAEHVGAPA